MRNPFKRKTRAMERMTRSQAKALTAAMHDPNAPKRKLPPREGQYATLLPPRTDVWDGEGRPADNQTVILAGWEYNALRGPVGGGEPAGASPKHPTCVPTGHAQWVCGIDCLQRGRSHVMCGVTPPPPVEPCDHRPCTDSGCFCGAYEAGRPEQCCGANVRECIRDHQCRVDGPCNGWPRS